MLKTKSLSSEQILALQYYRKSENIFLTGSGGTGKTEIIKTIYNDAKSNNIRIKVSALTGCAAVLLGCCASTIHSWSGIKLARESDEEIINRIKRNKFLKHNWTSVSILVIDEVSMMSKRIFDLLNKIGQTLRNSNSPFGGIQVIFSGDFFQLPPIGGKADYYKDENPDEKKFCFQSEDWNRTFPMHCQIEFIKIFRQTDEIYTKILNNLRQGIIEKQGYEVLMSCVGRDMTECEIEPTKLFPMRFNVDEINNQKLNEIQEEILTFELIRQCVNPLKYSENEIEHELNYIETAVLCKKILELKIGAQVMSIVNIVNPDTGELIIYNGSQGIIKDFKTKDIHGQVLPNELWCPIVQFKNGKEITMGRHLWESERLDGVGVSQIPLILCWALTIHKTQGMTLDVAEIDAGSNIFECGQTYVALSRVKSLDGLYLSSFDPNKIKIKKVVLDYYNNLKLLKS